MTWPCNRNWKTNVKEICNNFEFHVSTVCFFTECLFKKTYNRLTYLCLMPFASYPVLSLILLHLLIYSEKMQLWTSTDDCNSGNLRLKTTYIRTLVSFHLPCIFTMTENMVLAPQVNSLTVPNSHTKQCPRST